MKANAVNWDAVPDVITKDQLYRLPHQQIDRPVPAPKRENPLRVHGQENTLLQNQKGGCHCLAGKPQGVS